MGGGFGGGSFELDQTSVLGVEPDAATVGPLSSVSLSEGRALEAADAGASVAVVDAAYATTNDLAVGGTVELGGEEFEIVGIVASASDAADTAADVFIPLDVAQELSGVGDVVSTVYVQASSAGDISAVQEALAAELPEATVNSQSDLADTVSGSLSSASALITSLGTWLSIVVLAVAVLLAVLFTISGGCQATARRASAGLRRAARQPPITPASRPPARARPTAARTIPRLNGALSVISPAA